MSPSFPPFVSPQISPIPTFSSLHGISTCLWLESMMSHWCLHGKPTTLVLGFVVICYLLFDLHNPQGRYFCLHFTDEIEMERFQGISIITCLLPFSKSVRKLRQEPRPPDSYSRVLPSAKLPECLRGPKLSCSTLSRDSGIALWGERVEVLLGPPQPMGRCPRLRDNPTGPTDEGWEHPQLGKQKSDPNRGSHGTCPPSPFPGLG